MRPDPTAASGFCLLLLPGTSAEPQLREIGSARTDALTTARRTALETRLGITIPAGGTVQDLIRQLLLDQLRVSSVRSVKEVLLGNQTWHREFADPPAPGTFDPSDDFNRGDNLDLGSNWTVVTAESTWKVLTNRAEPSGLGGSDCSEYWNPGGFSNDQFSQATVVSVTGGSVGGAEGVGVSVRISTGAQTYYRVVINAAATSNVAITKMVAGTATHLAVITSAFSANDVLRLEADGSTLRAYKNGTFLFGTTDTSIASGNAGISYSSVTTAAILDDWSSGDLTVGIQVVGVGAEGSAASGNITLGAPASPVNNDIWIAVVHSSDQVAHTFTDWTQIFQANGGGTTSRLSVWYFRYAGSTPNLIVTHTAGQTPIGGIVAFRGCKTSGSPVNTTGSGGAGTDASIEHTAITPGVNNCMILACNGSADDNARSTLPANYIPALEDTTAAIQNCYISTAGTPDGSAALHYLLQTTAASTGTVTDTQAAADAWASVLVALEPAAAGTPVSMPGYDPLCRIRHMLVR